MRKPTVAKVCFIIICWNNRDLLKECFETIYKQTFKDYKVILIDNGSTDGSIEYIKKEHPRAELIETGKNTGFAGGNNIGIAEALKDKHCQYVALLNTDARLDKDWLASLVAFADRHPHGASFQTLTVDYYDHKILDSYGITIDHQGRAVQLGYRATVFPKKTQKVFGVNAAAALYSRAFLDAQPFGKDYFDSDLWMYLEDVDFAARATMMGWENWCVNESRAYHMGSASSSKNPGFSVYMCYRNNSLVLIKNLPFSSLIKILPGAIATDLITLWRLWRGKNYSTMKAIIKGRIYSFSMIFKFLGKRRPLKDRWSVSSDLIWQFMDKG